MHFRWIILTLLLVALTAFATSRVMSQDPGQMTPEEMELMKKWGEFMTPGPEHEMLNKMAGKWNSTWKYWMDPGTEPMPSSGTSTIKSILGGRYNMEELSSQMMGQPFNGIALTGYDNMKKKHFSIWIDSSGTGVTHLEGDYDAKTKTYTYTGRGPDVKSWNYVPMKMTVRVDDADRMYMEIFGPDKTGKEYKSMEMHMTRVKEPK